MLSDRKFLSQQQAVTSNLKMVEDNTTTNGDSKDSKAGFSSSASNGEGSSSGTKLYIGHLPHHVSKRDLEDLFSKYGRVSNHIILEHHPHFPSLDQM
jgi:RNA recognition motif-containing protein